jgi:hypothetical protein
MPDSALNNANGKKRPKPLFKVSKHSHDEKDENEMNALYSVFTQSESASTQYDDKISNVFSNMAGNKSKRTIDSMFNMESESPTRSFISHNVDETKYISYDKLA